MIMQTGYLTVYDVGWILDPNSNSHVRHSKRIYHQIAVALMQTIIENCHPFSSVSRCVFSSMRIS